MNVEIKLGIVYHVITGSKTPTSRLRVSRGRIGRGSTARKDLISATNHQWGMKKTPTDGSLLYVNEG